MAKPKRIRRREGDILETTLADGRLAYARILPSPLAGFYASCFDQPPALEELVEQGFAFKIWVAHYAFTDDRWRRFAHFPLSDEEREKPWFVHQDALSKKVSLYQQGGGSAVASVEQVENLEADAIWGPEQVVGRLEDYFAGKSNKHVESMRKRALRALQA